MKDLQHFGWGALILESNKAFPEVIATAQNLRSFRVETWELDKSWISSCSSAIKLQKLSQLEHLSLSIGIGETSFDALFPFIGSLLENSTRLKTFELLYSTFYNE
mmetsp:Transcript_40607/g.36036  ORF Transcript_40607/g.36036 Transcript_40607/m.36036 type:complete len:105 (-) Transcript_40607:150-464(-)